MAGTKVTWLGLTHMPGLVVTCVPAGKHMRTIKALADLYNGVVTFVVRDYEELVGMLEHLLPWAGGSRSAMLGLFGPLKRAMHRGAFFMEYGTTDVAYRTHTHPYTRAPTHTQSAFFMEYGTTD